MKDFITRYKPGAPVHIHLFVAALIWSLVGIFLMANGYLLLELADKQWLVFPAIGLGTIKSIWVLEKVARKNIDRILQFEDRTCIGSVYSYKTWGLIICMIVLGRTLRLYVLPGEYVGMLYLIVGWGLLWASRLIWLARWRLFLS